MKMLVGSSGPSMSTFHLRVGSVVFWLVDGVGLDEDRAHALEGKLGLVHWTFSTRRIGTPPTTC